MRLNLDHSEFLDFVAIMFYHIMKDDDFMKGNERFNVLMDKMKMRGMKSAFFSYYLKSSGESRKEFKRIKDTLKDDSKRSSTIFIYPNFEEVVKEIVEITTGERLNESKVKLLMGVLEERLNED